MKTLMENNLRKLFEEYSKESNAWHEFTPRMSQILQEAEQLIRKEVLEEVEEKFWLKSENVHDELEGDTEMVSMKNLIKITNQLKQK